MSPIPEASYEGTCQDILAFPILELEKRSSRRTNPIDQKKQSTTLKLTLFYKIRIFYILIETT